MDVFGGITIPSLDDVECRRGLTVGVMMLFLSDCITV